MTMYQVEPIDVLVLSILVLFLGLCLNKKCVPARQLHFAGHFWGLICSGIVLSLRSFADIETSFDLQMRDVLLLVFFSTIGQSAKLRTLVAGGRALLLLVVVAFVF